MNRSEKEIVLSELLLLKNIGGILLEKVPNLQANHEKYLTLLEDQVRKGVYSNSNTKNISGHSYIIDVVSSPVPEDTDFPWSFTEEGFQSWHHEVFLEGYKKDVPLVSVGDAKAHLEKLGYKVIIRIDSD